MCRCAPPQSPPLYRDWLIDWPHFSEIHHRLLLAVFMWREHLLQQSLKASTRSLYSCSWHHNVTPQCLLKVIICCQGFLWLAEYSPCEAIYTPSLPTWFIVITTNIHPADG